MGAMAGQPKRAQSSARRGNPAFTALGVIFLILGVGALGYVGWEYFGTNITSDRAMDEKSEGLRAQWESEPAPAPAEPVPGDDAPEGEAPAAGGDEARIPGDAVALLRIPALGDDYEVPILSGTDLDTLSQGVGWYDSAVAPGEIGNFSLAGHRITNGEPFADILELQPGDEVIVETRDQIHTYVMDTSPADLTVTEDDTWVLDPVPGEPDATPTQPVITLTTCQDLFHSVDRSIGFGHLASTVDK